MNRKPYPYQRVAAARKHAREAQKLLKASKRELSGETIREENVIRMIDDAIVAVGAICRAG